MRSAVVGLVMALGLCGCSDVDSFFGPDSSDGPQVAAPAADTGAGAAASEQSAAAAAPVAPAPLSKEHCTKLARQRAEDAAYEGEDEETQESVYNRTLSECTAWDQRHAL
ncbi:MAG: hypothetical protein JO261_04795 [Alphaproteobacteria bacterium]|nr:hypothetical protein [Alphaproteobacteria bacterium]MBV9692998.1 hypothetical protein [Alphaproteobacteria bacterium]